MVTDADLLDQMRQANPVPDAADLHQEPGEVAALWTSLSHRRASIMTDHTDVASTEAPARLRWYQRPIVAVALGVLAVGTISAPVILLSTDDGTIDGTPTAQTETTVPAESPSGGTSPATTSAPSDPHRVDAVDGLSFEWTRVALPGMPSDEMEEMTVAVFDGGLVVAGGNQIWMSRDGTNWTETSTVSGQVRDLIAGGPGLVAVSASQAAGTGPPRISTSADGITWTQADLGSVPSTYTLRAIADRGADVVAVGHDYVATSEDEGATWAGTSLKRDLKLGFNVWMHDVTVGGPGFVAVGGSEVGGWAAAWTSPDGVTWSRHSFGPTGGSWTMTEMKAVTVGGPGFVAVGHGPLPGVDEPSPSPDDRVAWVWTSPDGFTWTRVPHSDPVFGNSGMSDVVAYGDTLVAVGGIEGTREEGAVVWTSTDGITWQRLPHDDSFDWWGMHSVVQYGDRLVAAGGDSVWIATPLPSEGVTP